MNVLFYIAKTKTEATIKFANQLNLKEDNKFGYLCGPNMITNFLKNERIGARGIAQW